MEYVLNAVSHDIDTMPISDMKLIHNTTSIHESWNAINYVSQVWKRRRKTEMDFSSVVGVNAFK